MKTIIIYVARLLEQNVFNNKP